MVCVDFPKHISSIISSEHQYPYGSSTRLLVKPGMVPCQEKEGQPAPNPAVPLNPHNTLESSWPTSLSSFSVWGNWGLEYFSQVHRTSQEKSWAWTQVLQRPVSLTARSILLTNQCSRHEAETAWPALLRGGSGWIDAQHKPVPLAMWLWDTHQSSLGLISSLVKGLC